MGSNSYINREYIDVMEIWEKREFNLIWFKRKVKGIFYWGIVRIGVKRSWILLYGV